MVSIRRLGKLGTFDGYQFAEHQTFALIGHREERESFVVFDKHVSGVYDISVLDMFAVDFREFFDDHLRFVRVEYDSGHQPSFSVPHYMRFPLVPAREKRVPRYQVVFPSCVALGKAPY
jgi:hypothetical protein